MTAARFNLRRRGSTALIAMLFLVLMATMSIGFYASTTMSSEVSANDASIARAQLAADSGMDWVRYQLANITIPASQSSATVLQYIGAQLATNLSGSRMLGTGTVDYSASAVHLPAGSGSLSLSTNGTFHADITPAGTGSDITVEITGRYGKLNMTRRIQLNYRIVEKHSPVMDFGVATKGTLKISGGSYIKGATDPARGTFLSLNTGTTTLVSMSGGTISGAVSFVNGAGTVSGSGYIGGTNIASKWPITRGVTAPEFPSVDTSWFQQYLVGRETIITASTGAAYLSNIHVKANANPNFSGGGTIEGVVYIEAPNKVTFSGGTKIHGVIAVDNPNETTSTNMITFSGGGTITGPETLPASFGDLRTQTGASILAPNFGLTMTGGSATVGGTSIVKSLLLSGGSGGTFSGSLILTGTGSLNMSGGSGVTIAGSPAGSVAGLHYSGAYHPLASTYTEPMN